MMPSNGQLTVPPGFRFHPTDEELLYYYLRKKVAYEAIDLDVIRDVDLNKLEPWDLKDKCRIGTGPQNEWYFFSHKDKKYPTGTRTNRATTAGFWKATGRDKAIHDLNNSKRIGMRKTLVFYIGRAPHGQKTDWIMHEYRLNEENSEVQEEGWVVCRVFKKKNLQRGIPTESFIVEEDELPPINANAGAYNLIEHKQNNFQIQCNLPFDTTMQLPQLLSSEQTLPPLLSITPIDLECSQNLMKLTTGGSGLVQHERFNCDWTILDKLLASHQTLDQMHLMQGKCNAPPTQLLDINIGSSMPKFPLNYQLGCDANELLKFSKFS